MAERGEGEGWRRKKKEPSTNKMRATTLANIEN